MCVKAKNPWLFEIAKEPEYKIEFGLYGPSSSLVSVSRDDSTCIGDVLAKESSVNKTLLNM